MFFLGGKEITLRAKCLFNVKIVYICTYSIVCCACRTPQKNMFDRKRRHGPGLFFWPLQTVFPKTAELVNIEKCL